MSTIANGKNHGPTPVAGPTVSGRVFVAAGLLALLATALAVYLAFLDWRTRYRALAEFGAKEVAPLVEPLRDVVPAGVDPESWRRAVADVEAMLLALTGAGVLGRAQMEDLRSEVASRVARSTPATVVNELSALWDDLERRAGPILAPDPITPEPGFRHETRHRRPRRPELLKAAGSP